MENISPKPRRKIRRIVKWKKKKKKEKRKKATINLWHAGRVGRRGAQQNKDVSSMVKVDKGGKVALETNGLTITHSAV